MRLPALAKHRQIAEDRVVKSVLVRILALLVAVGLPLDAPAQSLPGLVQFSAVNYTVGENGGTALVNVTRTGGAFGEVSVGYAAGAGSATAGGDFAAAGGTLQWADGDAGIRSFLVWIANDSLIESNETVLLTLNNPAGGAALGALSAATLTIADDDGPASLVISNHSFELPAIGPGTFSTTAAPPGWSAYGNAINFGNRTIGVLRPVTTTLYAVPVPDGRNVGVIFLMDNQASQTFFAGIEAGMRQTLAATLQTRRQYALRVEVGNIANDVNAPFLFGGFPNYRIDLLAGTNVLASDLNTLRPGEGRFLTSTVSVAIAASHPFAGQPLGLRLVNLNNAPGIEVNFDNVRLDSTPVGRPPITLVGTGADWKYLDDQTDPGAAWRAPGFDDAGWSNGVAQLGFGDGDEATVFRRLIGQTPIITAYFRKTFVAPDPRHFSELSVRLLRDDGGAVYLNGVEIFRSNLPVGAIDYSTFALLAVPTGLDESAVYFGTNFPPALLVEGTNTLAVEIHQVTQFSSTDMSFDCELLAHPNGRPVLTITHEVLIGRIRLIWPDTGAGPFSIETAADLDLPGAWTPLPGMPVLNAGRWSLSIPTPAEPRFFRLRSP